jgi:hypothetical protein
MSATFVWFHNHNEENGEIDGAQFSARLET